MSRIEIEPLPLAFREMLRGVLRGKEVGWPRGPSGDEVARFLASTASHGIQPLLHHRSRLIRGAPELVVDRLRSAALMESALDVLRTDILRRILDVLNAAKISVLVAKGTALARSHYPSPDLRPRADHDLLIHIADLDRVSSIVAGQDFSAAVMLEAGEIFSQRTFIGHLGGSLPFAIDVHWRCANLEGVADALVVDAVFDRSIAVEDDEIAFKAPCSADALIWAAIHRAAHHFGTDRLLWLSDVHLLFESLRPDEEHELWSRSREAGVSCLCADALNNAAEWFGTRDPAGGMWPLPIDGDERAASLLRPGRTRLDDLMFQMGSGRSLTRRLEVLRAHLFPPRHYMAQRYGVSTAGGLFGAYARRIIHGIAELVRGE